jgi:hypothetical protein
MSYAPQALPRRRLILPVLALGGLVFLFVLSVGLVLADKPDTVQVPKPDSAKVVHPDSAPTQTKQSIFNPGTGRLAGQVTDSETGKGIFYAEVRIQGTRSGAVADTAGYYAIINIPPGEYTVQATALGYSTVTKKNVKVLPDLTTVIRYFKLKQQEIVRP